MKQNCTEYLQTILHTRELPSKREQIKLILRMSFPAILAQVASVVMQYIDASMIGRLGANDSASIGLVSSSIWLLTSIGFAANVGFYVLVAQKFGSRDFSGARNILKIGAIVCSVISLILAFIGISISNNLPEWLGGSEIIRKSASDYFVICTASLPILILGALSSGLLQSSGNMKIPSILNMQMCFLDVVFNFFFIFPSQNINICGLQFVLPGCDLGVRGAAFGTVAAELVTLILMVYFLLFRSPELKLRRDEKLHFSISHLRKAFAISLPVGFDHIAMCGAMVVSMMIVSPLGTISIATHSFAITAESFCYMAGYGIASAATTIVGQSVGAGNRDLTISFSWLVVKLGMTIMSIAGILMFIFAPFLMAIMTPVCEIQELGADVLRIEAFAEPFYGASIVVAGAVRGAGDTLFPSVINTISMWIVRIPLSVILAMYYGLHGIWLAMCFELCVRGTLFLIHLKREKWLCRHFYRSM